MGKIRFTNSGKVMWLMLRNRSIAFKLIFMLALTGGLVFSLILGENYLYVKKMLIGELEENARNLAQATVNRVDIPLYAVQKIPESLAYSLETINLEQWEIITLIKNSVENNREIFGSTIAYEPNAYDSDKKYYAPYYFRGNGKYELTWLGGENYDYFSMNWYQKPKNLGKATWTEPYFDDGGGNTLMTTYSVPFYKTIDGEKKFMGVVTADISLGWLKALLESVKLSNTGYGFIICGKGRIVTHPVESLIMKKTIFDIAREHGNEELGEIGRKMINGESGFVSINDKWLGDSFMVYAPLSANNWSVGAVFPKYELFADIRDITYKIGILFVIGFVLLLLSVVYISRAITRPISRLAIATKNIAAGDLDTPTPPVDSGDEIGELTKAFDAMQTNLKDHIKWLTETTAVKERMQSELNIAHEIQMSILPKTFPPFPNRPEFDIHAMIESAKEVGGDFYDFFFLDDETLFFVIGDVSDKGVPASLFMSATKTLIRAVTVGDISPDAVMQRVNQVLGMENDSCMFVTIFCASLNTRTGEVTYSNAGHNPPIVIRNDGAKEFVPGAKGVAAGVFDGAEYTSAKLTLAPGEGIILYTDGVTEAMNAAKELFGETRLVEIVGDCDGGDCKTLITRVFEGIKTFAGGEAQSDDITMLSIKYKGLKSRQVMAPGEMTITIKNHIDEIHRLAEAVEEFGAARELDFKTIHAVNLALEELIVNTISYGYAGAGEREIKITISTDGYETRVLIEDDANEFDPFTEAPHPDLTAALEDRPIGGLGIHLICEMMDATEYKRENGINHITLVKKAEKR